jgi:hypothetical protein
MMISVVLLWFGFFLLFAGIGSLLSRLLGSQIRDSEDLLYSFWVGWASAVFILQLWHIQFPVDWRALALLSMIGIIGLLWNGPSLWNLFGKNLLKKWPLFLLLLVVSFWLANRAIGSARLYDTGLYHLPAVNWIKAFPLVPGLGNLHGRLAFNSSYFLYSALLESGPWAIRSWHLSGGLLLLVLFAQILLSATRGARKNEKTHHLFMIIMFTPVLIKAFGQHVSSLSPDLPVFILGILVSWKLLELLEKPKGAPKRKEYSLLTAILLAALGITIKLSFLFFGLFAAMAAATALFSSKGVPSKKIFVWIVVPLMVILICWMARGVILSGYPLYPSTVGSFPVEWRLPKHAAMEEAKWVRSWARKPNAHWNQVLGNWDWLKPWASRMTKDYEVMIPSAMILMGFLFFLFTSPLKWKTRNRQGRKWLLVLPPIASLIYWFFTAPDIRYVGASFWVLGAGLLTLGVSAYLRRKIIWIGSLSLALLCSGIILERTHLRDDMFFNQIYPLPHVELERFETRSGLTLLVPQEGDQCWNGPLLCTPFPKADLRLRGKADLSKGFVWQSRD